MQISQSILLAIDDYFNFIKKNRGYHLILSLIFQIIKNFREDIKLNSFILKKINNDLYSKNLESEDPFFLNKL